MMGCRWPRETACRARKLLASAAANGGAVALVYHADADGIASAALASAAIERLGGSVHPLSPPKGENVYAPAFRAELARAHAAAVLVLDTGARPGVSWRAAPTVIVDHHPTSRSPDVEVFLHEDDAPATASLVLRLAAALAPVSDRAWLAAVGTLGDAGDLALREPYVADAVARYGQRTLRDVVSLVNASGRAASPAPEIALEALRAAPDPRLVARGEGRAASRLHAMRAEVAAAVRRARRAAPHVRGRWAIIEIDEPCRVHGVIASAWSRRLAPRIVLVANRGYVPGRVHISVRAHEDLDLRAALRDLMPDTGDDYAAGHRRATGAILDAPVYDRLLQAIEADARA